MGFSRFPKRSSSAVHHNHSKELDYEKRILHGKEYEKIKAQVKIAGNSKEFSSDLTLLLESVKHDAPELAEQIRLLSMHNNDNAEKDKAKTFEMIRDIAFKVDSLDEIITNAENGTKQNFDGLQETMKEINDDIFKAKSLSDEQEKKLNIEETVLTNDLEFLMKDFDSWTHSEINQQTSTHNVKSRIMATKELSNQKLPEAVEAYEDFVVKHGGLNGGWDAVDHQEFLLFRQKYGRIDPTSSQVAAKSIPTKSPADIVRHEFWYSQYLELAENRKEAVDGWKKAKLEEELALELKAADQMKMRRQKDDKIKKEVQKKQKQNLEIMKNSKLAKEKEMAKKAIKAQHEHDELARTTFQKHQMALKRKLELHYKEIEDQLSAVQSSEEQKIAANRERHRAANAQVSQLAARELLKAEHKKMQKFQEEAQLLAMKSSKDAIADRIRERIMAKVEGDLDRLVQPTESWKSRVAAAAGDGAESGMEQVLKKWNPADIENISRLRLSEWRNTMN